MTPGVGEVPGSTSAAEEFFSCGGSRVYSVPSLPAISDGIMEGASADCGEQLSALLQQIQRVTKAADQLISGRPDAVLCARPHPGRWSAAECFDHLARTTQVFLPPINNAIAAAPGLAGRRKLRTGTVASVLIRSLEPPYRLKHKVPAHLAPRHQDFSTAWTAFLNSQPHLSRAILFATGRAIDEVKIQSPVCARLSYNAYGALGILAAHQRRHLWQAEQALKSLETSAA